MAKVVTGSFTMCVEPRGASEGFERTILWKGDRVPDLIYIGDAPYYKAGRYLSLGDRYRYIRARVLYLEN